MSNLVTFGLSNVHVAKRTVTPEGVVTHAVPSAIPGAVNLSLDPQGESSTFRADNRPYYITFVNNGYDGELEIADIPEQFLIDYLGYVKAQNNNLVETDAVGGSFALLFQVEGDAEPRKFVLYNCTCSRGKSEHKTTEDKLEVTTSTLTFKVAGEKTEKGTACKVVVHKADANFATLFTAAVALPEYD